MFSRRFFALTGAATAALAATARIAFSGPSDKSAATFEITILGPLFEKPVRFEVRPWDAVQITFFVNGIEPAKLIAAFGKLGC